VLRNNAKREDLGFLLGNIEKNRRGNTLITSTFFFNYKLN